MKITIEESSVSQADMWTCSNYKKKGFYTAGGWIVYVDPALNIVMSITQDMSVLENNDSVNGGGGLSEDFVLKLIALSSNKETFNQLK